MGWYYSKNGLIYVVFCHTCQLMTQLHIQIDVTCQIDPTLCACLCAFLSVYHIHPYMCGYACLCPLASCFQACVQFVIVSVTE